LPSFCIRPYFDAKASLEYYLVRFSICSCERLVDLIILSVDSPAIIILLATFSIPSNNPASLAVSS